MADINTDVNVVVNLNDLARTDGIVRKLNREIVKTPSIDFVGS